MWWDNTAGFMKRGKKWREWMNGKRTVLYSESKRTYCCQEGQLRTGQCLDWCSVQPGRWPSGCPRASAPFLTHSWTQTEKIKPKVTEMMRLILLHQWHCTLTNWFLHFRHSRRLSPTVLPSFICTSVSRRVPGGYHHRLALPIESEWMGDSPLLLTFSDLQSHTHIIMTPIFA